MSTLKLLSIEFSTISEGMGARPRWERIQVLDGGFGTELEAIGYNTNVNYYEFINKCFSIYS